MLISSSWKYGKEYRHGKPSFAFTQEKRLDTAIDLVTERALSFLPMKLLTKEQIKVLRAFDDAGDNAPYSQVAKLANLKSKSTVGKHVKNLEKLGVLKRVKKISSVELTPLAYAYLGEP